MQDYRINEQIRAKEVRLIDAEGVQVGVVSKQEAMERATAAGLDLVEVAPNLDPPVCRVMDYGKFKYKQKKKQHHHVRRPQLKEIRVGLNTGEHDLEVKAKRIREFIDKHDKVLVSMRLRGRQFGHAQMGRELLQRFAAKFEDVAKLERAPSAEAGGRLSFLLAPK